VTSTVPDQAPQAKRFAGKPFAIAFGTFLIVGTLVFFYFAQRAELARQEAIRQMEADGVAAPE
jgi:hypothetical protein